LWPVVKGVRPELESSGAALRDAAAAHIAPRERDRLFSQTINTTNLQPSCQVEM
jgi:hypothetical protein